MTNRFEVKMAADVLAALHADDDNFMMLAEKVYTVGRNPRGVTIASARICDDDMTVVHTRYYAGFGVEDLLNLQDAYQGGFEPPSWWTTDWFDPRH